jgi:hypothetical protein
MLAASALFRAPAFTAVAAPRSAGVAMYGAPSGSPSLTGYVAQLENEAYQLSAKLGLGQPRPRCIGDDCLTMESYIDLLEDTLANMQSQYRASDQAMVNSSPDQGYVNGAADSSLSLYLSTLENKVQVLSTRFGVPMPQQCDADSCMPLQSYIDLLEDTYRTLEAQWDKPETSSGWGDEYTGRSSSSALTTTGYLQELEGRVQMVAQRTGLQPPSQCDEESCLELQSYIELLEDWLVKAR